MKSFDQYWIAVIPDYDTFTYTQLRGVAERAYKAGAKHERTKMKRLEIIREIVNAQPDQPDTDEKQSDLPWPDTTDTDEIARNENRFIDRQEHAHNRRTRL